MEFSAAQLAEILSGSIEGNPEASVNSLSKIEEGKPGSISFLSNPDYTEYIYSSKASIVIVDNSFAAEKSLPSSLTLIRVEDARMSFAKILEAYKSLKVKPGGIHPTAVIEEGASIGDDTYIGPHVFIASGAKIGTNCQLHAGVRIGDRVTIGDNSTLFYNVIIHEDCAVGSNCLIQHGAVIGGDGFGFQPNRENEYAKVTHIGNVIIEDHVEVGSNTTIDRATMGSTFIRKGVKLDNLIQVGHNVDIGENTVIASQTGIAGSTIIGKNCMVGGQVGFAGHQRIADGVKIAAQSGISKDIKQEHSILQGSPAFSIQDYTKSYVYFRKLPKLVKEIDALKKELQELRTSKAEQ